ncbi:MAG: DUF255 domain-containing protein [Bacteroidales bacterium]|jgi:thioredoxin-related protein|nr:DUF255 domain-containing protein [Bacteroidales bacterium]MCK9498741.1 DUF255 domain-containing protein [Bacteroidales bacterium]MDY0315360.1 DUF255 domain-containing protein [Bacteroidales bacterium]NLB87475.1 DUF255 domain-containing protein [Bacteroidales bacterium]
MKNIFFTLTFALLSQFISAQTTINWLDFETAVEMQKENPKTIFIDMYTDWCGWCKKMDAETFQNPDIANYINTFFYPVKFNAEGFDTINYNGKTYINPDTGRRSSHQLAQELMKGRLSYPTIVYIDYENQVFPVPGYMDPQSLEPLLIYFSERINKLSDFTDFHQEFKNTFFPDSTSDNDGVINWINLEKALELRLEKPKKLFLFINSDFNNSSKIMLASALRHPVISNLINENFYPVKFDFNYQDSVKVYQNTFINENLQENYPHQFVIALLQPDIRLPSIVFFGEDFSLIFALRGFQSPKQLERFLEFFSKDLHKTGEDWNKFNENFKSKL